MERVKRPSLVSIISEAGTLGIRPGRRWSQLWLATAVERFHNGGVGASRCGEVDVPRGSRDDYYIVHMTRMSPPNADGLGGWGERLERAVAHTLENSRVAS